MLSQQQITAWLQAHRRRLKAGDDLPAFAEIARRTGLHRDVIFAAAAGERFGGRAQWALSRVIEELENELLAVPRTRVMSVSLSSSGARLSFGCSGNPIFRVTR